MSEMSEKLCPLLRMSREFDATCRGELCAFYDLFCYRMNKPKTKADKIRAMSDEELAELIGDNIDCAICKKDIFGKGVCPRTYGKDCHRVWIEWLREEAET